MCAFDHLPRSEVERLIQQWIRSERDRAIVSRKWLDGLTFEKVSEEFELSVTQVKTICYKAQNRLIDHI